MQKNITCPKCGTEITDITTFKEKYTCPNTNCCAFLKNDRNFMKLLLSIEKNVSGATGKKSAVGKSNPGLMGIKNVPTEPTHSDKNSNNASAPAKTTVPNEPKRKERPHTEKVFNQDENKKIEPQGKMIEEDMMLFEDDNNYIPPDLDAMYDDDNYDSVEMSNNDNMDSTNNNTYEASADEYDNFEDDENDEDYEENIWGEQSTDSNDSNNITATLASFDDDEDDEDYNDADILGAPQMMDYNEELPDNDNSANDNSAIECDINNLNDDISDFEEPLAEDTVNDENQEDPLTKNNDLDLFTDLNAVATPQPKKRPNTIQKNIEKESLNIEEETFFDPDIDDNDDVDDDNYPDFDTDYEDEKEESGDSEEINSSIASKLFKKALAPKSTKEKNKTNANVTIVNINDDIGRKIDKSLYNSNKDGYYNDNEPFVDPEPDIIPSGSILKVIGIFVGLIFFTAYFIFMF